jgi:hypothetical protein
MSPCGSRNATRTPKTKPSHVEDTDVQPTKIMKRFRSQLGLIGMCGKLILILPLTSCTATLNLAATKDTIVVQSTATVSERILTFFLL